MGAMVGLGLGCATSSDGKTNGKGGIAELFPYFLLVLIGIIATAPISGAAAVNFVMENDVFFWLARTDVVSSVGQLLINTCWMVSLFLLIVCVFDSIGQLLGRELSKHESLHAYSVNLLGSAAGVIAYNLLAFLDTPPGVWLIVGLATVVPFYKKPPQLIAMIACIAVSFYASADSTWSPYYRIQTFPKMTGQPPYQIGTIVEANHVVFQQPIDLSESFVEKHPELKALPEYTCYNIPYEIKKGAQQVLVVGAGSGNDVAAALRHKVGSVDAVEIDPEILNIGKTKHPERPYEDPRVSLHVNDARQFLAVNKKKYDLIVFGFLDSTISFSMLSSVRLDNFLYTLESLKTVTSSLGPDGVACVSFAAGAPWLRDRLFQMAENASGSPPVALKSNYANNNSIIVLWGPGLTKERRDEIVSQYKDLIIAPSELSAPLPLCTDNWPFLYQKEHSLTWAYGVMLALLLTISGSLTIARFRLHPKNFVNFAQFFFLGAGFLLLETRAILAVAILFGSTWLVNSIVILLILLMALAANLTVQQFKNVSPRVAYSALFISLLVLYLVPMSELSSLDTFSRLLAAVLIIGLPFFCAGLVFSRAYSQSVEPNKALGINILGALLGGCLEYSSVIIGTKDLVIVSIVLYALSAVASKVIGRKT